MIHILDAQTDKMVGVLDNKGDRIYWDDNHTQGTDGYNVLQFVTFADIMESSLLGKRSRVLIESENGYHQEFIVFESTANTARNLDVVAVGSETDIDKQIVINPQKFIGKTTEEYLTLALDKTEWKVGNVEYGGVRTIETDKYIGGYEFLQMIAKAFDMELVYRVETDGNIITGRYVDLVARVGEDTAKEIVYGKDLVGITRKVFSERIVTAIFTIGPEPKEGEGERITTLVTDGEAFQRWNRNGNHIIGIHEPQSEDENMTLERLKTLGRMELNKRIDAVTEYEVIAESIEDLHEHEKVRLGDTVRIVDTEFEPPLYATARVISVSRTLDNTLPKEYVIGNVIEYDEDEVRRAFLDMQKQYGMTIVKNPAEPEGKYNVIWIDTSGNIDVAHTWDGTQWVKFTPTEPGDIGAITPDESKMNAEIENLKTIKRILTTNQSGLNLQFDMLADNPYIAGTIYRSELDSVKADADSKHLAAINRIDDVILDDYITPSERADVIAKIEATQDAQNIYESYLTRAFEAVAAAQAKEAKDQAEIAEQAAADALVKAETALTDVVSKVDQSAYDTKIAELIGDIGSKAGIQYVDDQLALIDAGIAVQDTAPVDPQPKDLWLDTTSNELKRWDGTKWVAAEVDLSSLDVYTKTQVDQALAGKVETVTYTADKQGLISDITANATAISQNATDITLKANQTTVDALAGDVATNTAAISVNATEIALKANSETVTSLQSSIDGVISDVQASEIRLSDVELKLTDSEIISTVTSSTQFEAMFNQKADASDLAGYATSVAVDNLLTELEALGEEFHGITFGDFVTSTELAQRDLSLIATISASSGVNLIRNSVGLAKLEGWTVSGNGTISATGNPELDGLGYHSGFLIDATGVGVTKMSQDVAVIAGKDYTLSYALRNVNATGNVVVRVLDAVSGAVIATVDAYSETGAGVYGNRHKTFTPTTNQLRIEVSAPTGKSAIITALMLNIGTVAFSWTTAVGELYNTTIKMDLNGLRVSQYEASKETGFTVMTPEKFAGYYNESGLVNENTGSADEVFRMDKDEFVMKKANVKEEITMGPIKVIEVNETSRKGWAFVPNFD